MYLSFVESEPADVNCPNQMFLSLWSTPQSETPFLCVKILLEPDVNGLTNALILIIVLSFVGIRAIWIRPKNQYNFSCSL